jgi:hypothetical protein
LVATHENRDLVTARNLIQAGLVPLVAKTRSAFLLLPVAACVLVLLAHAGLLLALRVDSGQIVLLDWHWPGPGPVQHRRCG